ncbi:hypothetical protein H5410_040758 [Solanum commersonii]|uniref:Uncharacterized protein n=1 Tax=Solanum commersonii TaxID=4109 RepID=A0A9J5XSF9_SOLCO|nr:hypothetical protein H5410_040758 [Solanum commersonii]
MTKVHYDHQQTANYDLKPELFPTKTLLLIANPRDQKVNKNQNQPTFNRRLELIPSSEMGRTSPWKPRHQYHHTVN